MKSSLMELTDSVKSGVLATNLILFEVSKPLSRSLRVKREL